MVRIIYIIQRKYLRGLTEFTWGITVLEFLSKENVFSYNKDEYGVVNIYVVILFTCIGSKCLIQG